MIPENIINKDTEEMSLEELKAFLHNELIPAMEADGDGVSFFWNDNLDLIAYKICAKCGFPKKEHYLFFINKPSIIKGKLNEVGSLLDIGDIGNVNWINGNCKCKIPPKFISSQEEYVFSDIDHIDFEGKNFVLTGFGEDEEEEITDNITYLDGQVKSAISKKTDYLICNEEFGRITSKYKKARELQKDGVSIIIIDSKTFFDLFDKEC